MKTPNPKHVEQIIDIINKSPYFQLLSMKIRQIGLGYSIAEIDLSRNHLNPFGGVHGGVFSSIIDSVASWAFFYGIEDENAGLTSVDLKLNYLSPVTSGKLIAEGRQIKLGGTLGYGDARVTDKTGDLVAHGTLTVMVLPGKAPATHPPLPRKFAQ